MSDHEDDPSWAQVKKRRKKRKAPEGAQESEWRQDGIWWVHPTQGTWTMGPEGQWLSPEHVAARQRRAMRVPLVTWLLLAAVGACTVGACVAAPHIGWTGWGIIILIWYFGRKVENLQDEVHSLRQEQEERFGPRDY